MVNMPYDPTGVSHENIVSSKQLAYTDQSIYVPKGAPFYSATVKLDGELLTEGIDYEYVYSLAPLETSELGWWGGIMLVAPTSGMLEWTLQSVGGRYVVDVAGAMDTLIKLLNSAPPLDWETQITHKPVLYPATITYDSWYDFLNKIYLSTELDTLGQTVASGVAPELSVTGIKIRNELVTLRALLDTSHAEIHADAVNVHNTTTVQLAAQRVEDQVQSTHYVYDKGLGELTRYLAKNGFTYDDLIGYLTETAERPYLGTMRFSVPKILERGLSYIELGEVAKITGKYIKTAGMTFDTPEHNLTITATGAKYDGNDIVTVGTLPLYIGGDTSEEPRIKVTSYNLDVTGDGSSVNPITIKYNIIEATDNPARPPGGVVASDVPGTARRGAAVTSFAVSEVRRDLETYVPSVYSVNGKRLNVPKITITRDELGLGTLDNTADMLKPLSVDLLAGLDERSDIGHAHDFEELGYLPGTSTVAGTVVLADGDDDRPGAVLTPAVLKSVVDEVDRLQAVNTDKIGRSLVDHTSSTGGQVQVSGWRLTVDTVLPVLAVVGGVVTEAEITGIVNLDNITVTDWYSPNNYDDLNWAPALLPVQPPQLHSIAKVLSVDETFYQIGSPTKKGIFKGRLGNVDRQYVNYSIRASRHVSLRINGESVIENTLSGGATLQGRTFVTEGPLVVGIGITTGASTAGWLEAIFYDDSGRIIGYTDDSWQVAYEGVKYVPDNNVFYLYGDISTGKLVALGAPHNPEVIDASRVMIGVVYTSTGKVKVDLFGVSETEGTLVYERLVDIGQYESLYEHINSPTAHHGLLHEVNFVPRPVLRDSDTIVYNWRGPDITSEYDVTINDLTVNVTTVEYSAVTVPVWELAWLSVLPPVHSPYRYTDGDCVIGNVSSWTSYLASDGKLRTGSRVSGYTLGSELSVGGYRRLVLDIMPVTNPTNELTLSPVSLKYAVFNDDTTVTPQYVTIAHTFTTDVLVSNGPIPTGPQRWTVQYKHNRKTNVLDILYYSDYALRKMSITVPVGVGNTISGGDVGVMGESPITSTFNAVLSGTLFEPPTADDLNSYNVLYGSYLTEAVSDWLLGEQGTVSEVNTDLSYAMGNLAVGYSDFVQLTYPTSSGSTQPTVTHYEHHRGLPVGWLPRTVREVDFKLGRWAVQHVPNPTTIVGIYRKGLWGVSSSTWRYVCGKL